MHFKIQTEKDGRMMNLKGRNFLKLMDYTSEEILYLIDLAADLKKKKKEGILHDSLIGKNRHQAPLNPKSVIFNAVVPT